MANHEQGNFFNQRPREFQPFIQYRDEGHSPFVVAHHTAALLDLVYQGGIGRPTEMREYFKQYTLAYLQAAQQGSVALYEGVPQRQPISEEAEEATRHAFVIFAWMHKIVTSRFLPNGFSKKGMLRAPTTQEEFKKRTQELQFQLAAVATGTIKPHQTLETNPSLLRFFAFFKTGSNLPLKFPESEREQGQRERERLNDLLAGIDLHLD